MNNTNQGIASYISMINQQRLDEFQRQLNQIIQTENISLESINIKEAMALEHLNKAKVGIDELIQSNRGGKTGLHGFIAESAEVGVANAKRVLQGLNPNVFHLNDNGKADLLIDSLQYQMKFYNNPKKALEMAAHYRDMSMMYPEDMVKMCDEIMKGSKYVMYKGQSLSLKKINSIKKLIEQESNIRNEVYTEWMKPSKLKYSEVQKNQIHSTLEKKSQDIKKESKTLKKDVKKSSQEKVKVYEERAQPTLKEANKSALFGAAFQGSLTLGASIYRNHKEGKEIFEYNINDWKELGLDTSKSAIRGGISGYSIYFLTNFMGFSAPAASAVLTSVTGIKMAVNDFRSGEINAEEFLNQVMVVTSDAGVSAIGATLGQQAIPIPIIGAVIGSSISNTALKIARNILNDQEKEIIKQYSERNDEYISRIDEHYQRQYQIIKDTYLKVENLQNYLLEINTNIDLQLASSIQLAQEFHVPEEEILHNIDEIDHYFLS